MTNRSLYLVQRPVVTISRREEENIGRILDDVRRSSSAGETSQTGQTGFMSSRSHTDPGPRSVVSSTNPIEEVDTSSLSSIHGKLKEELVDKRTNNSAVKKMMASFFKSKFN